MSFSISWEQVNILSWGTYVLGIVWWSIFLKKYCISCPSLLGTVFDYFRVSLGVSTISGEPVNILSWNFIQVCLILLWQLLHQKKIFHLIVLSTESHFGVFLSLFWPKIFKCSHEIEEYSYVPRFFWESFNIFSWNFLQAFLVSLSLFFFQIILKETILCLLAILGSFLGIFFMKFYTAILGITLVSQHQNVFLHDLAPSFCLGSFVVYPPFLENCSLFL